MCYNCRQTVHTRKYCPLVTQTSDLRVNLCSLHSPHMGAIQDKVCTTNSVNEVHFRQHMLSPFETDMPDDECAIIESSTDDG